MYWMIASNIIILNALIFGIVLLINFVKEVLKVFGVLVLVIVGEFGECVVMICLEHFKFELN